MIEPQPKVTRNVVKIPPFYRFMVEPHRYKVVYGGRGAARSWTFARLLVGLASSRKLKILCAREFQASIKESVHQLLSDQIEQMGLSTFYTIQSASIKSGCGSEFIFKGLRVNPTEIKSLEGIDIAWLEEAQSVSNESLEILIPTIRKDGSEIWISMNTGEIQDPTYQRFVLNPPDDCVTRKATYADNPYFPATLEKERCYLQRVDPDAYSHIWEGDPKSVSDSCIFKNKYIIDEFEAPKNMRLYFGADWGFSDDPTTLIRSYMGTGNEVGNLMNHLYIEYEAYGVGVELDDIPELFDSVPGSREWTIKADNQRPDTISYIRRKGFSIVPCMKWPSGPGKKGSVKEGIEFLRKFEKIHIHSRCKHMQEEAKLYSFKTDSKTNEVLPIVVDKHNHCWDGVRYSFDQKIKGGVDWSAVVG